MRLYIYIDLGAQRRLGEEEEGDRHNGGVGEVRLSLHPLISVHSAD